MTDEEIARRERMAIIDSIPTSRVLVSGRGNIARNLKPAATQEQARELKRRIRKAKRVARRQA